MTYVAFLRGNIQGGRVFMTNAESKHILNRFTQRSSRNGVSLRLSMGLVSLLHAF